AIALSKICDLLERSQHTVVECEERYQRRGSTDCESQEHHQAIVARQAEHVSTRASAISQNQDCEQRDRIQYDHSPQKGRIQTTFHTHLHPFKSPERE